jgi:hypothetical protein
LNRRVRIGIHGHADHGHSSAVDRCGTRDAAATRIQCVSFVRGVVMILMAVVHVRVYARSSAAWPKTRADDHPAGAGRRRSLHWRDWILRTLWAGRPFMHSLREP